MAAYTNLDRSDVDSILSQYPVRAVEVAPFPGGAANSSYFVRTSSQACVLTVLDNHDRDSAQRLSVLLRHLVEYGVPTSRAMATKEGCDLTWFHDRPVLVKEYVPGQSPVPEARCQSAGDLLARIHAVPAPASLTERGRRLPADWLTRADEFADRRFAGWLQDQAARCTQMEHLDGPYGLVHGDFFPDNLVMGEDGSLSVLDWETATRDLLLLDIGMAIVGLCRVEGRFLPDRARSLLEGYEPRRRLSIDERRHLRDAVRYASLLIGYHRYLRHHVVHPDPSKQHLYQEIPQFVLSLDQTWSKAVPEGGL